MPLAAHCMAFAGAPLGIEQDPCVAACRTCALASIVLRQAACDVVGPTDVSQMAFMCDGAENIDIAVHVSPILLLTGLSEAVERTNRYHRLGARQHAVVACGRGRIRGPDFRLLWRLGLDRKSTRLNSSHLGSSYAVFCLKKKTDAGTGEGTRSGAAPPPQSEGGPRPGHDLSEVPAQGAAPPLRVGCRPGRRPGALAAWRTAPGTARRPPGSAGAVVPAQSAAGLPGGRPAAGRGQRCASGALAVAAGRGELSHRFCSTQTAPTDIYTLSLHDALPI